MTTSDLIDYYVGLLILQYASLNNALGTVRSYITALVQDQIIVKVRDAFDVTTAIGVQLNMLAQFRGLTRNVFGAAAGNFWSLVPYADPAPGTYFGWAEYGDPDPTWKFFQYNDLDSVASALTDNQLRRLILYRAQVQTTELTLGNLDDILYSVFGPYVTVVDNEDMTITYNHSHTDPDTDGLWALAVLTGSLPHPAGVSFTVVEV